MPTLLLIPLDMTGTRSKISAAEPSSLHPYLLRNISI